MLELRDVTLCAVDCIHVPLAARALRISMEKCRFGDTMLISHLDVEGPFRSRKIDRISSHQAYSTFILKKLGELIETSHVLMVQWDGYVLDPTAWSGEFLRYDYIGAPWPWRQLDEQVGNGGFSLRSRKLLNALTDSGFVIPPGLNEDSVICDRYRKDLERRFGIRFAPPAIAELFSYELATPEAPTFGFHGMLNLFREVDDSEMCRIAAQIELGSRLDGAYAGLLLKYYMQRKFEPMRVMYARLRSLYELDRLSKIFADSCHTLSLEPEAEIAARCISTGEEMLRRGRSSSRIFQDAGRFPWENNRRAGQPSSDSPAG